MSNGWAVVGPLFALLAAIAAAAGGYFTARAGRTASPYDALANRVTELESQRKDDFKEIERQSREISELKQRDATSQTQIAGLERRVAAVITDRDALITYVFSLREWWATGGKPPAPPIPLHLRDIIPDWSPTDADRSLDVSIEHSDHYPE